MDYTKEEIIEATKICTKVDSDCDHCPLMVNGDEGLYCRDFFAKFIAENFEDKKPIKEENQPIKKEFDWENFRGEYFAVSFKDEKEYNTFMKLCKDHNFRWADGTVPTNFSNTICMNVTDVAIGCNFGELVFGSYYDFDNDDTKIIPFSDFTFLEKNNDKNNTTAKETFNWDGFIGGDFVVHIKTGIDFKKFMKGCENHNLLWQSGMKPTEHTPICQTCVACKDGEITFSSCDYYMNAGKKIVSFSDFSFSEEDIFVLNTTDFTKEKVEDTINPAHYRDGKIEVIEYIEDKKLGFCLGNAVKYISRAGKKHSGNMTDKEKEIDDLKKAKWYIERRIKEIKKDSKKDLPDMR